MRDLIGIFHSVKGQKRCWDAVSYSPLTKTGAYINKEKRKKNTSSRDQNH